MNIVFFGSAEFSVPSLRILLSTNHRISCVVTQPDQGKGRGLNISATPVKAVALKEGLKLYQPKDINTPEAIKVLKDLNPDLLVVIAYGQILSQKILDIPRIFCINLHASILPKYRGAAPINWAIINGEPATGATVMKMVRQMDAGPIILQNKINISDTDDSFTLEGKLSDLSAHLLLEALKLIESGEHKLVPQEEAEATFAPKLKKEDGLIKWDRPAQDIHNLIRGCIPWPGAFTYYDDKLVKIFKAKVIKLSGHHLPGEIISVTKEHISVSTGKEGLNIEELQKEGKRRMPVQEFIAGNKIRSGRILGNKK